MSAARKEINKPAGKQIEQATITLIDNKHVANMFLVCFVYKYCFVVIVWFKKCIASYGLLFFSCEFPHLCW